MALPILTTALMSAGLGLAKNELFDRPKFERDIISRGIDEKMRARQGVAGQGYSDIKAPDAAQTALDFGLAGAGYAQNQNQLAEQANFRKDLLASMNKQQAQPQPGPNFAQQQAMAAGLGPMSQEASGALTPEQLQQARFELRRRQMQNQRQNLFGDTVAGQMVSGPAF